MSVGIPNVALNTQMCLRGFGSMPVRVPNSGLNMPMVCKVGSFHTSSCPEFLIE